MKMHTNTITYTNFVLTVIAVLLLAGTVKEYGVPLIASVHAQDASPQITPPATSRFSRPGRSAPLDLGNVAQTQDTAVASATNEVAAANRDIAAAIRELARSMQDVGAAIRTIQQTAVVTGAPVGAAVGASGAVPVPANKSVIEVGPPASK